MQYSIGGNIMQTEAQKKSSAKWRMKPENKAKMKQYQEDHKEELHEYKAEYRKENKGKIADAHKTYYEQNKEQILAKKKVKYYKDAAKLLGYDI